MDVFSCYSDDFIALTIIHLLSRFYTEYTVFIIIIILFIITITVIILQLRCH